MFRLTLVYFSQQLTLPWAYHRIHKHLRRIESLLRKKEAYAMEDSRLKLRFPASKRVGDANTLLTVSGHTHKKQEMSEGARVPIWLGTTD